MIFFAFFAAFLVDFFALFFDVLGAALLERPIERIRKTCEMTGAVDEFDRALPELETYLEEEIAAGEISEARLTDDGLCFLRQLFQPPLISWRNYEHVDTASQFRQQERSKG